MQQTEEDIVHSIDWRQFSYHPISTNRCKCGGEWRSHVKGVYINGNAILVAQKPCPDCGSHIRIFDSRSDTVRTVGLVSLSLVVVQGILTGR